MGIGGIVGVARSKRIQLAPDARQESSYIDWYAVGLPLIGGSALFLTRGIIFIHHRRDLSHVADVKTV